MRTLFLRSVFALSALLVMSNNGCIKPDRLPFFETDDRYANLSEPEEFLGLSHTVSPLADQKLSATIGSGGLNLSVEQAITFAMANNRNLKIQQINPELAATLEAIERGIYDPQLFGELTFSQEESSKATANGSRPAIREDERNTVLGLRQTLPTGTKVEASIGQDSTDISNSTHEQSSRVGLTITQSLLRGLGPTVNLVSLRQAQLETEVSSNELRGITEALLAETETSYWDYVLAGQEIEIFERSLAVARQQLDEIQQRIDVGTLPRIEAAAAHSEVARHEQALIDAHSTLEERRLRLLRLINPASNDLFALQVKATSTAEINPAPITDLPDRLLLADQSRPDLNEARLRLKQNRLELITTRNGLLPKLDLFITLGKSGYADSFSGSFKDLDENNHDISAGITLSHDLNNRQAKAHNLAARATRRQAADSVDNLKELVELDVRLAVNEFERTRKQISATRTTRLLQEETLKAERDRFDVGISTALLVAQAQRDLLLSTIDEAEAIINCRKALIALYLAEGSLLERRGVRLAGFSTSQKKAGVHYENRK